MPATSKTRLPATSPPGVGARLRATVGCVLLAGLVLAGTAHAQAPSPLARVQALGLETARIGRVEVYFAPGDRERAEQLAALSGAAADFYRRELGISFEHAVAALAPEDWFSEFPGMPYGMPWPSMPERLILMPSSLDQGLLIGGQDELEDRRTVDFVLLHEYAHLAAKAYFRPTSERDYLPVKWFEELVANSLAYAFVDASDPEWASADRRKWQSVVDGFTPPVLSLDWSFMNDLPPDELARVYGWYQNLLNLRAAELHEEHGLGFLRALRRELDWQASDDWTTESLLPSLEAVAPGFEAWAGDLRGARARQGGLAITGATLIDGTGAPARAGMTVLIRDGLITGVGTTADTAVEDGVTVIDAAGKYVIPGLADMHVHFGTGGLVPSDPHTVQRVLRQFLFYGVTTVLNVGATGGGVDDVLRLRELQARGRLPGPHVYATGGLLTVPGSHPIATIMHPPEGVDGASYDWSQRGVWVVSTPAEMRELVGRMAAAGMDGVKIVIESGPPPFGDHHPQMSSALVGAAVEEAARHELPVFAHASSVDELREAVTHGVRAMMHLVKDPAPPGDELLAEMKERGIFYVPTLSLFVWADAWGDPADHLSDPFLRSGVEPEVIASLLESRLAPTEPPAAADWSARRSWLAAFKAVHDAGVRVVGGSDTANPFVFPGYSMHHELELMVEAGLTPMEALVAATRRAAEMLGAEDAFGTVAPGKRADLLILGADPLEDIRNTRTLEVVIRGGEVVDRETLLAQE